MTLSSTTTVDFEVFSAPPASALTPADADEAKALIVSEGSRLCSRCYGKQARAIALTGSMSRGETTLKREGAFWRVLGDATFLIVFENPVALRTADLQTEIERALLERGVICKIAIVTANTANLRHMKPHIYAYELRERGIVVGGDKDILALIPSFAASDIPKEDGWWLLCNRMIEQLESAALSNSFDDDCVAVQYRIAKLYLAMAACYLLAIGCYEPTYRDRARRLRELALSNDVPDSPIDLLRFSKLVSQCTELKLNGETVAANKAFPRWRDAVSDAESLWRWTLCRITGSKANLSRHELLAAIAGRQTAFARTKSWLRATYVRPSQLTQFALRSPWLPFSTSPRYLVYGAASDLFFMAPEPDAANPEALANIVTRLPISAVEAREHWSWEEIAKLVVLNFRALLESNRS